MATDITTTATDDAVLAVDVDIVVIIIVRCGATTNDCATIRLMVIIGIEIDILAVVDLIVIIIVVESTRDEVAVAVLAVLAVVLVRVMLTVYAGVAALRDARVVRTVRMLIGFGVLVIGSKAGARIVRIFL